MARHLNGSFGEIRITRLEPESAVAWEGERASGTVRLEPSGWGTRVILTARRGAVEALDRPAPRDERDNHAAAGPSPGPEPAHKPERAGLLWRLRGALRPRFEDPAVPAVAEPGGPAVPAVSEPGDPAVPAVAEPEDSALQAEAQAALAGALDSLGQAHHRPFSRS